MAKRKGAELSEDQMHFKKRTLIEPTHFSDLNDDCFRVVLSFLPTNDLCAMKKVNTRFVELADDAFHTRYRHQPYIFGPKFGDFADRADFSSALKVVRLFGQFITTLSVHNITDERDEGVWDDIFEFCVELKSLKMTGCVLKHCCLSEDSEIRLEKLHFVSCTGRDTHFTRIINSFESVKRIVIECCYNGFAGEFLTRQYPALEEISIRRIGVVWPTIYQLNSYLRPFIRSHTHLKKIDISFYQIDQKTLRCIAKHSRNVESLSFFIEECEKFDRIWPKLVHFNLKELQFVIPFPEPVVVQFIEALAEKNVLETLSIAGGYVTFELYTAISKLTNLKTLKLVDHLSEDGEIFDLSIIWDKLELNHLHLITNKEMDYEHCTLAIEKMRSLESLTFVPRRSCACNRSKLNAVLPQWINARKSVDSGFPLKIFLSANDLQSITKEVVDERINQKAISIQWRHGVNENDYVRCVIDQDLMH